MPSDDEPLDTTGPPDGPKPSARHIGSDDFDNESIVYMGGGHLLDDHTARPAVMPRPDPWERGDAPIELLELDRPREGLITARRDGEPSFHWVQDFADAMMAALARGVDLIVPQSIFDTVWGSDPQPPDWNRVRADPVG